MKINEDAIFAVSLLACVITLQPFIILLVALFWLTWEDSKWPAFDSEDYDKKMMHGPLKPWSRGN